MSWNIFKRIALLEQRVKDLADFNGDEDRKVERFKERLIKLETSNSVLIRMNEITEEKLKVLHQATVAHSRLLNSYYAKEAPPVVDEKLLKERQYRRELYAQKQAKKKLEKDAAAAHEKRRAYARAYYKRKKEQSK